MIEMDANAFRMWLTSFVPSAVVGWSSVECYCPLAVWLHREYGQDFGVNAEYVWVDGAASCSVPAPGWVSQFVVDLDGWFSCEPVEVSAQEALQILDRVLGDQVVRV
jgi:hypothetical protein